MGDLKEGFNHIENERDAMRKMAVVTPSGQWLPRGLTFGPTNGPEDFQEAMYIVFSGRLFKEWFLFIDDLAVATGRPRFVRTGPTGAGDLLVPLRLEASRLVGPPPGDVGVEKDHPLAELAVAPLSNASASDSDGRRALVSSDEDESSEEDFSTLSLLFGEIPSKPFAGVTLGQRAMIASAEAAARDCYEKGPPTLRGLLWALRSADIPLVQSGRMFSLTGTPLSMLWSWGCTLGSTA